MVIVNHTQPSSDPAPWIHNVVHPTTTTTTQAKKVVIMGPPSSGKTSWLQKVRLGNNTNQHPPTLGVEVYPLNVVSAINGDTHKFHMWDTAGQEKLSGIKDGYYVGSQGFIFFFDLTIDNQGEFSSVKQIPYFLELLKKHALSIGTTLPKVVFVANKMDLVSAANSQKVSDMLDSLGIWLAENSALFGITNWSSTVLSVQNGNVEDLLVPLLEL